MAIEAVNQVKDAEEKAGDIITNSEREASELLLKAAEDAKTKIDALTAEEKKKMQTVVDAAEKEAEKEFEIFAEQVSEKCSERRKAILADSDRIIGKILEAVKMG